MTLHSVIKVLTTFKFSQDLTHINVSFDQFVIIQMCCLSIFSCPEQLNRWPRHSLSHSVTHQCCQPVQIICICPDICAFSVLDNRHCADICAFCQKCQFEVEKGRQVLLLQSKAEDMHCKQADSAILKLLLVQGSMGQIYFITKQTYVVITCFCRNMGYVAFTRILSQIGFCREYALFLGLFCPDFYADI